MSNFLEELKATKVIGKNDIQKIQKFINIKYKEEDTTKKAYMVSSTIHNIIESKISFFPKSIQKYLKNTILKNTFLNNKDCIYLWDIFCSYIDCVNFKKENIEILLNWINNNIENKTDEKSLVDYLFTNNLLENYEKNIAIKNDSIDLQNSNTKFNYNNFKENSISIISNKYNSKNITKKFNINFLYKNNIFIFKLYNKPIAFVLTILLISLISIYLLNINTSINNNSKNIIFYENKDTIHKKINTIHKNPNVPKYIKYKSLDTKKLKKYLYDKNSLLGEDPYFSSIMKSAEEFDINPLILFAITGQEQGFVPKNNKFAKKIANNPFNVFHSWEEYNSNIKDSSRIAARTVFNLLNTLPKGQDPFKWVNNTYAEDPNWWKGVKSIFNELGKNTK